MDIFNKYQEYVASNKYVKSYKGPRLQIAEFDFQKNFNDIILRHNIKINNQKSKYSLMADNEEIIEANYYLSLKGDYLALLKYLDYLDQNSMLYKIDSLNLIITKDFSLQISLNLRSLYESS